MSVSEVKDLGDGKFSVRLDLVTQSPDVAISHAETVSADGYDNAVEVAKQAFVRWLEHVMSLVAKHPNADSDRYRPPFRDDAAHDSDLMPPTIPE
jgi:hypothetical protein